MDGPPVDPESAWSGYAGATRADPFPGAAERSRHRVRDSLDDLRPALPPFDPLGNDLQACEHGNSAKEARDAPQESPQHQP